MNIIAALGENNTFVAFNAHWGFAFFLMTVTQRSWKTAVAILVVAAAKEFWFDIKYETDPPQTYTDGAKDWIGYAVGVWLGLFI